MKNKKFLYILTFIIGAVLLINIIWPSAFLNKFKREVFQRFKNNSETYIKIKNYIVQKAEENNSEAFSIGRYGEIIDNSNDILKRSDAQYAPEGVKEAINELVRISENDYDFVRLKKYKGGYVVSFEFDWEGGRNKTHQIVYCEDEKILNEYLQSKAKKIYIKNIENQWYYVELDSCIFHK